jgi:hypothetical protein
VLKAVPDCALSLAGNQRVAAAAYGTDHTALTFQDYLIIRVMSVQVPVTIKRTILCAMRPSALLPEQVLGDSKTNESMQFAVVIGG